jgi:hypothetical protein
MDIDDRANTRASDAEFERLLSGSLLITLVSDVSAAFARAADNSRGAAAVREVLGELRRADMAARLRVVCWTVGVAIAAAVALYVTRR